MASTPGQTCPKQPDRVLDSRRRQLTKNLTSAQSILIGAQRIDEMKRDVHRLVQLITTFLDDEMLERDAPEWTNIYFSTDEFHYWTLERSTHSNCLYKIQCYKQEVSGSVRIAYSNTTTNESKRFPELELVQFVYDMLPALVVNMTDRLPELDKRLAPFYAAAIAF